MERQQTMFFPFVGMNNGTYKGEQRVKKWRPIVNHGPYEVQHLDGAGEGDDFCYRIVPALPGDEGEASTGYETATAAVHAINERGNLIF